MNTAFEWACQDGWEKLEEAAQEIFGPRTKVYSQGRSGGWAVVDHFTMSDVEDWNDEQVNNWFKFVEAAEALVKDIPYIMVDDLYHNVFLVRKEEQKRIDIPPFADMIADLEGVLARIVKRIKLMDHPNHTLLGINSRIAMESVERAIHWLKPCVTEETD